MSKVERLAQSETFYPSKQEPHNGVTAIAYGIRRFSDGQWYDFNDSTFKAAGWTTKHDDLAEDDDGLWTLDAGWAIPDSNEVYQIQWKITDPTSSFYERGPKLIINDATLPQTSTQIGDAVRTEPITDAETLETLGGMIHAIYCAQLQQLTVTDSARTIYKLDDNTILRAQTLADDDTTVTRGGG